MSNKGRNKIWIFLGICLLSGCMRVNMSESDSQNTGANEEQSEIRLSLVCNGPGVNTTYEATGDKIVRIIQTITISDSEIGVAENTDRKKAEEALEKSAKSMHSSLDGIDISIKDTEKAFEVTTVYDLEKADLKQLEKEGLLQGGDETSSFVSFQKTRDRLNDKACPLGLSLSREKD
ncbi:DUF1307 domain-containing protein [Ileibacterium valens]|uniref:DUF1307 domain-containing protein n=1 Tax=Ileibacterium valens TaxID=1862668 RepID=UPI00259B77FC|nr:DUF1307 domain-containing protein [Ileibacterium valens]